MQAKDITDRECMAAVKVTQGRWGVLHWSTLWDVQAELKQFPPKLVRAKLSALVKRGFLTGSAVDGQRGDFEITSEGEKLLH